MTAGRRFSIAENTNSRLVQSGYMCVWLGEYATVPDIGSAVVFKAV